MLKLSGTHQLPVCADDVNLLRGNIHMVKKNTGALLVPSKESGLEVNIETFKYMFMPQEQSV